MSDALTRSRKAPRPEPEANFGYLFRLAHQRFRALMQQELEPLGLSAQEYTILSVFETRPELSISEVARIAQVTRQTIHTTILRLETAGLLGRTAHNQRVVLVMLTASGRRALETATERIRDVERAAFADLTRRDERAVRAWLVRVAAMTASPARSAPARSEKRRPATIGAR
jgi:DNA-binding MarR family transcriptional regulator